MPACRQGNPWSVLARGRERVRAFLADRSGIAAVEFGIVAMPFFLLVFGVVSVGTYFFQVSSVEAAALQAARAIRVGHLQQSQGTYAGLTTDAQKKAAFLQAFCNAAVTLQSCLTKTVVIVQSSSQFSSLTSPSCAISGAMVSNTSTTFSPGATSSVVMVTVCYPWMPVGGIPFANLGNLNDGSFLVQATVAFRTEPY
ncbi:MAG: TadE/TadG family type IV pilus assembly protein [Hyphomicrobiaceae bacterium]|nr:TadE/TadG family type IV pilus assembly protein [Hyphomicrobiaceae bacterium]